MTQGFLGRWASFLKMPSTVAPLVLAVLSTPCMAVIHIEIIIIIVVVFQPAEIAVDLDFLHGIA
jgi:hypothetical protein